MRYLGESISFSHPQGAKALTPAGGVSWRVFSNLVSLGIGGIAAVILELAHPQVRHGVWDHTRFRHAPLKRMIRTAKAAMITVYAPEVDAKRMIARVNTMHKGVSGETNSGSAYTAFDSELLSWVHATASFGFLEAYIRYVATLTPLQCDTFYAEGKPVAQLYGALAAPENRLDQIAMFDKSLSLLEPSDTLFEFLGICEAALPVPRALSARAVRSAVGLLPPAFVETLSLQSYLPTPSDTIWIQRAAKLAGIIPQYPLPFGQASRRMGTSQTLATQR